MCRPPAGDAMSQGTWDLRLLCSVVILRACARRVLPAADNSVARNKHKRLRQGSDGGPANSPSRQPSLASASAPEPHNARASQASHICHLHFHRRLQWTPSSSSLPPSLLRTPRRSSTRLSPTTSDSTPRAATVAASSPEIRARHLRTLNSAFEVSLTCS